mmetsp:Transcript_46680/g.79576  ORF Transcript_46680/g.79576 Transcript_46680/m.79576 type:complete len:248 (-) Transcript_46680:29-772(-)
MSSKASSTKGRKKNPNLFVSCVSDDNSSFLSSSVFFFFSKGRQNFLRSAVFSQQHSATACLPSDDPGLDTQQAWRSISRKSPTAAAASKSDARFKATDGRKAQNTARNPSTSKWLHDTKHCCCCCCWFSCGHFCGVSPSSPPFTASACEQLLLPSPPTASCLSFSAFSMIPVDVSARKACGRRFCGSWRWCVRFHLTDAWVQSVTTVASRSAADCRSSASHGTNVCASGGARSLPSFFSCCCCCCCC